MNQQTSTVVNANDTSSRELFALTDEQILEIEPAAQAGPYAAAAQSAQQSKRDSSVAAFPRNDSVRDGSSEPGDAAPGSRGTNHESPSTSHHSRFGDAQGKQVTNHVAEPPQWLAEMMDDPEAGSEARDLWTGMQQARQESAAYREAFAKPEDARALKELYPGGVEQARAAAERARTLEEIDSAFYGRAGKSAEQLGAGRAALAQRMLREDPAAFREMVFAGLRALEEAGQRPSTISEANALREVHVSGTGNVAPPFKAASSEREEAGLKPSNTQTEANAISQHDPRLVAYRAFEKTANEELERSVGGAISRALEQALPAVQRVDRGSDGRAQRGVSLQERLGGAIRSDVETALKGDRQLAEQITQVLSTRRFDDGTRMQLVRLINDRAQQLVPSAARRVIQDWTQTAFASHRGSIQHGRETRSPDDSTTGATQVMGHRVAQSESTPATNGAAASAAGVSAKAAAADRAEKAAGLSTRTAASQAGRASRVDYRKLSDEQILEL